MKKINQFRIIITALTLIVNIVFTPIDGLAQYILSDDDVVISNGIIQSCSYDFSETDITIPDTLDGQKVLGIADNIPGVFENKNISSITLPDSIIEIGDYAFANNKLSTLNLSDCSSLETIGNSAFTNNTLYYIHLDSCLALKSIGSRAFENNDISNLDLSKCYSLQNINSFAFKNNNILNYTIIYLCHALTYIGPEAFYNNNIVSMLLPVCSGYSSYGWKDCEGGSYAGANFVYDLSSFYYVDYSYTIQDEDVVVTNGIIQSCSYDFRFKHIVIPDSLNGQKIIGVADLNITHSGNNQVITDKNGFANKDIIILELPPGVNSIGSYAFCKNNFTNVNLSGFNALESIGEGAFSFNKCRFKSISLSACSSLESIEKHAFMNEPTSDNSNLELDLSDCTNLLSIGDLAFYGNNIIAIDLHKCLNLNCIGENAFACNKLDYVYLAPCSKLTHIGKEAFQQNNITSFVLPVCTDYEAFGWTDGNNNQYHGGEVITNLASDYFVNYIYTLQNDDVVVNNNIIDSCSYDFMIKRIIIPDSLDDQLIIGIADRDVHQKGVFEQNCITYVLLPDSLKRIGKNAFKNNQISSINLGDCIEINSIGKCAFTNNNLSELIFENNPNLSRIDSAAFSKNKISNLDINNCNSLAWIGKGAFSVNTINGIVLPTLDYSDFYEWKDSLNQTYNSGDFVSDLNNLYYADGLSKTITFKTFDEETPVAGVKINFNESEYILYTDDYGEASVASVYPGIYSYSVFVENYIAEIGYVTVKDSHVILEIYLQDNSVHEFSENTLQLYPNPTCDFINCQLPAINYRLSMFIIDLYGKALGEKTIPAGQTQSKIEISNYPPGVYMLVLKDETNIIGRGKFVKQ